nr:MAG TPA: hypothetical protein [Caudoviricetes sp.]
MLNRPLVVSAPLIRGELNPRALFLCSRTKENTAEKKGSQLERL